MAAWRHDLPDAVNAVRVAARVVGRRQLALRPRVRQLQPPSAHHRDLPEGKTGRSNGVLPKLMLYSDFPLF